jgi:hypothetical protein
MNGGLYMSMAHPTFNVLESNRKQSHPIPSQPNNKPDHPAPKNWDGTIPSHRVSQPNAT